VLRVERIGINDNFFQLGGHSLLATQVISRIRQIFKIELPLRALFENPTIARLASKIEAIETETNAVPPIIPVSRDLELPLSFAQQRLWFIEQFEPASPNYNIATALKLTGQLNIAALTESLNELVKRHESLRTTISAVNGKPLQRILPFESFDLEIVEL